MATPYDPVLSAVGFLRPGSSSNRQSDNFVSDMASLLRSGNFTGNPMFHFQGDTKTGDLLERTLTDGSAMSPWYGIFIEILHKAVANSLNVGGATPLAIPVAPVFDVSSAPALGIPDLPLPPPGGEVAWALALAPIVGAIGIDPTSTLAALVARLNASGVITPLLATPPVPPGYSLGNISGLEFLNDPSIKVDGLQLPGLVAELVKLPFNLLNTLYVPSLALVQLPAFSTLLETVNTTAGSLAASIPQVAAVASSATAPVSMLAAISVWLKNMSALVATLIVGLTVGTGNLAKTMATTAGLI
jgi:hypothetical protein